MKRRFRFVLGLSLAMTLIVSCTIHVFAQSAAAQGAKDPLVQVLVNKGILTSEDAKSLSGTPTEQHDRLIQLLKEKGVISASEYSALAQPSTPAVKTVSIGAAPSYVPAVMTSEKTYPQEKKDTSKAAAPTFVPAVAPVRVLQLEPAKPGGLIPDVKLGSKAALKFYGFFKASSVYDTSSPNGDDFPLPGFLGDTPANGSPEFHLKARSSRFGANFEFPDVSDKLAVTGKIEFDFEGNFSRADNRNISSVRSNMPSLRLAWGRVDYKASPETGYYFLAGQDWTPFGSSILPNTIETTGVQIGFGSLYERAPQMRVGFSHDFGGERHFTYGTDFAITFPGYGNLPPFSGTTVITCPVTPATPTATSVLCTSTAGPGSLANQLGYGERQGADSGKPEVQGRIVLQWQADKAKGVAPAQIVLSGMHATRALDVPVGNFNLLGTAAGSAGSLLRSAFPHGLTLENSRYGWSAGFSVPTRYVTVVANYYRGTGLRWYFAGQIYQEFNNTAGFTGVSTATIPGITNVVGTPIATPTFLSVPNVDGSGNVAFGLRNGALTPVPQLEPRAQGGFAELEFPLSRIFNAEPTGRNAGWTMTLHYGYDAVLARDVRRLAPTGGRGKSDVGFGNLQYKLNNYVTLGIEESYYRTRAFRGTEAPFLPLFQGRPQHQWQDIRTEFATIFTF